MVKRTGSSEGPRQADTENSVWHLGNLISLLVTGDDTDGRFAMFEVRASRGCEPPCRIHHEEDEIVYVLEGHLTYFVGDERYAASAGTSLLLPRGVERSFSVDSGEARLIVMVVPAGLEDYFREVGTPASRDDAKDHARLGHTDIERLVTVAARYGIEIAGPPPTDSRILPDGFGGDYQR